MTLANNLETHQFSFEEYCEYIQTATERYEWVDGRLELMNPPTFRHLLIAKFIEKTFENEIQRLQQPLLTFREAGVRTGWRKSRLTDVYVLTVEQVAEFLDQSAIIQTPPLLIVEVVSPDSGKTDYRFKRSEYAAIEVPEYWIIDPFENKVTVLEFVEGLYEEAVFSGEQRIVSVLFPELNLTVEQVFSSGNLGNC